MVFSAAERIHARAARYSVGPDPEEASMAKKKKATTKAKVRDLKPRKQVKGGARRTGDPCDGGEIYRRG